MKSLFVLVATTAMLAPLALAGTVSFKNGAAHGVLQDGERRLAITPTAAARRLALVIGNDGYPRTALKNAVNDARSMGAALQATGFTVSLALNTSLHALDDAIRSYLTTVQPGDVALIYYSGHGMQIEGENFLIPVDFGAATPAEVRYQAYSASKLLDLLQERGARLNILVLDACRDNPFRSARSASGGLAAMDAGKGTYIAFATAPGRTASDNESGVNGLFTGFLVDQLGQPGLTLDEVFNRVREKVIEKSNSAQVPWSASSVVGSFSFREQKRPPDVLHVPPSASGAAGSFGSRVQKGAEEDPEFILRHFNTLFVDVQKNLYFDSVQLETSLASHKDFSKLHITIIEDKAKADTVLSVAATAISGYPFKLIDQGTNSVLITGWGMGIGPTGLDNVANKFVNTLMQHRKDARP